MKEKTLAPPKPTASEPDDRRIPPRLAGLVLVAAGILLMLLSGWTPVAAWENASSEGSAIVSGGAGGDDLFGDPGGDVIVAGEGDDFIEAKGGAKDHISCGPGDDVASVDGGLDLVASDCETVYGS